MKNLRIVRQSAFFIISDIFSLVADVIYQVLLVADFEIYPSTVASQIEDIFVFSHGILEMSGSLLSDTCAIGSDDIMVYIIGYRKKLGSCNIYDLLANYKTDRKSVVLN